MKGYVVFLQAKEYETFAQINGDEGVDDGIRQLIETPGSGKGDTFVVPQVFEKFCKGIHLIITGKKKWIFKIFTQKWLWGSDKKHDRQFCGLPVMFFCVV